MFSVLDLTLMCRPLSSKAVCPVILSLFIQRRFQVQTLGFRDSQTKSQSQVILHSEEAAVAWSLFWRLSYSFWLHVSLFFILCYHEVAENKVSCLFSSTLYSPASSAMPQPSLILVWLSQVSAVHLGGCNAWWCGVLVCVGSNQLWGRCGEGQQS